MKVRPAIWLLLAVALGVWGCDSLPLAEKEEPAKEGGTDSSADQTAKPEGTDSSPDQTAKPEPAPPSQLVNTADEAAGKNCKYGGVKLEVGIDDDANGSLAAKEVDATKFVCNGNPTPPVPNSELVSLEIQPNNASAPMGFGAQFALIATWDNGIKLDVSGSKLVTWKAEPKNSEAGASLTEVEYAKGQGIFNLSQLGDSIVTATYDNKKTTSTEFTVTEPVIIRVDSRYHGLDVGEEKSVTEFVNPVYSAYGWSPDPGPQIVLDISDTNVISLEGGTITARNPGCSRFRVLQPTVDTAYQDVSWLLQMGYPALPDGDSGMIGVNYPSLHNLGASMTVDESSESLEPFSLTELTEKTSSIALSFTPKDGDNESIPNDYLAKYDISYNLQIDEDTGENLTLSTNDGIKIYGIDPGDQFSLEVTYTSAPSGCETFNWGNPGSSPVLSYYFYAQQR